MIKKLIVLMFFFSLASNLALATEKIPVSITPNQTISTEKDEVEFGDTLNFKVSKDVYKGDYLVIKKDAPVVAEVDYVAPNGWAYDRAYIQIKKFKILDSKNKWLDVQYPLKIMGQNYKYPQSNIFKVGAHYITAFIRGYEVVLNSDQQNFNIFILN